MHPSFAWIDFRASVVSNDFMELKIKHTKMSRAAARLRSQLETGGGSGGGGGGSGGGGSGASGRFASGDDDARIQGLVDDRLRAVHAKSVVLGRRPSADYSGRDDDNDNDDDDDDDGSNVGGVVSDDESRPRSTGLPRSVDGRELSSQDDGTGDSEQGAAAAAVAIGTESEALTFSPSDDGPSSAPGTASVSDDPPLALASLSSSFDSIPHLDGGSEHGSDAGTAAVRVVPTSGVFSPRSALPLIGST